LSMARRLTGVLMSCLFIVRFSLASSIKTHSDPSLRTVLAS
jgi:hypothetical protein